MLTAPRSLILGSCLVVLAIAPSCGGGPTSPSGIDGTTVAGIVNETSAARLSPSAATAGLTVTVAGTNLSATVESSGYFQLNGVPPGTVSLQFRGGNVNATVELRNVGDDALIEIQVQLRGSSATIVDELRSENKVSLCHSTGNGSYHMIDVSNSSERAHRAHGDGKVGDPVPGQPMKVFDRSCRVVGPEVQIVKSTNGQDANEAPGPTIAVGSPVTWTYVVTNSGSMALTSVAVRDDKGVTVTCPATTLAVGASMTCRGSGVAVAGQYRNVGTVTASSESGRVTDTDASHYFGQATTTTTPPTTPPTTDGPRVQLCHRTGNGRYQPIEVSREAEASHRAHGDGKIGEAVPDMPGKMFGPGCSVN